MEEAADYAKNVDGQRGLSKEWVFPYKDQPIQRMNHAARGVRLKRRHS